MGDKQTMTPEQENEIRNLIIDKNPEQLKLPGCMWTRENIRDLIERKYKISIPLSTYKDNMNSDKLIDFMRRLTQNAKRKVFLVQDNLRVHHPKKAMTC